MTGLEDAARATTSSRPIEADLGALRQIRVRDLAVRFAFGATISAVAALLADVVGPRFGGLFLAFPAILPASLTLVELKDGNGAACHDAQGAVVGAVGLVTFALLLWALAPRAPGAVVVAVALAGWLVVSVGGYLALRHARPPRGGR